MRTKIIGLTGGIGSGKSKVATYLESHGFPVYTADDTAKALMQNSTDLKKKIIALFGDKAYVDGQLNRSYIAERAFNDSRVLAQLNALVHPAVAKDFDQWKERQNVPYVIKEAAILFETGGAAQCDILLLITAPETLRLERVMQRDGIEKDAVKARMAKQWSDKKKIPLADKVIENITWKDTEDQLQTWIKNL